MTQSPVTLDPEDDLNETSVKNGFAAPSFVDSGELVGVIITSDFLEAFLDAWGVCAGETAIVDVVSDRETFDFAGAVAIIAEQGAEILGVGAYRERWNDQPVFYIRFRLVDAEQVAEVLRTKGYNVLGVHCS
jgi:hypothetical protein